MMEELNLNTCVICQEHILTDIEFLPCACSFHKDCIHEWFKMTESPVPLCPICKIPINIVSPEHLQSYKHLKA